MLHTLASRATPTPRWRPLAWAVGIIALLLLAAWTIPPMLDWGRFRNAIASIAAARLGRPVVIGGEISLRLLPQAVLTASDVTLADPGDGISVQVAALRLQVATLPLAAGRLVLRDLVLSAPVLHVPWALPGGIGQSTRPQVPHPFAARIENGTLRIGEAEITGITASIHGGPAIGGAEPAAADAIPVAAFGAEGFASTAGRSWRFTGALGAPDADGVSAVDIAVRGQGAVGNTDGLLQGTLADGVMQGRLRASGPDLSLLMPASAAPWRVEAPFVANGDRIEVNAISLSLGGAPADGALVLRLNRPARLDGHLHAAALDLNGWAALLGRSLRAGPRLGAGLLMRLGLSADTARLLDGELSGVQATLVSDGTSLGFDHAEAGLPGGAHLAAEHARLVAADANAGGGGQSALTGAASLSAPDLRATLGWLRALAPGLADAVPDGVLRQADLTGVLTLRAGGADVSGMTGRLDGSPVSGGFAAQLGLRPSVTATLELATLPLDPWLGAMSRPGSLAAAGRFFTRPETSLHIKAAHASLRGIALDRLVLDARTGLGGLALQQAEAGWNTARMSLSGSLGPDGSVTGARLSISTPSLELVLPQLRPAWRWAPGLWQGAGTLQLAADGPPGALALQLRADAGDVVIEADALRDTLSGTGTTTLTLRHPGAPRLLTLLGVPQAMGLPGGLEQTARWLDTGALTLRAHLQDSPDHMKIHDFDLDAAALRVSGQVDADWSGKTRTLTGTLAFEQLALPDTLPNLAVDALAGWNAHLHVSAAHVTVALRPVASGASAGLDAGDGRLHASTIAADVAGGKLAGDVTAELAAPRVTAHAALTGARITAPLTGWPIDMVSGTADLTMTLDMAEGGPAALSGTLGAKLHDAEMAGFNLAQLAAAVPLRTKTGRDAVQMALSQGRTAGLSGSLAATVSHGRLVLSSARLESADGSAAIDGGADLAAGTVDAHLVLSPALPGAVGSGVGFGEQLSGAWRGPSLVIDRVRRRK